MNIPASHAMLFRRLTWRTENPVCTVLRELVAGQGEASTKADRLAAYSASPGARDGQRPGFESPLYRAAQHNAHVIAYRARRTTAC
jgi:hypothetical protein